MTGNGQLTFPACLLGALLLLPIPLPRVSAAGQQTAGWLERVVLQPEAIELKAKLDTGAEHSSLHATHIARVVRGGREQVRFRITTAAGEAFELEQPLVRHARIKSHNGPAQERPVVMLTICLGTISRRVEVNLTDRSGFDYPLLLGRSFLAEAFLIDPASRFRLQPDCPLVPGR